MDALYGRESLSDLMAVWILDYVNHVEFAPIDVAGSATEILQEWTVERTFEFIPIGNNCWYSEGKGALFLNKNLRIWRWYGFAGLRGSC